MAAKTISSLAIRLSLNSDAVKKGVTQANSGLQRFGDRAGKLNTRLRDGSKQLDGYAGRFRRLRSMLTSAAVKVGIFAAAVAGLRAGLSKLSERIQELDEIGKFADRIGITANQLQALRLAAQFSGVSVNALQTSLQRMTRRIGEAASGSGAAAGALRQLGLDANELLRLQPELALARIFDQLVKIEDQGTKLALASKIFDTEGAALLNSELAFTSDGLVKINEQMAKFGLQVSKLDTDKAAELNDNMAEMKMAIQGIVNEFVRLGRESKLFDALTEGVVRFSEAVRSVQPLVGNLMRLAGILDSDFQVAPILSREQIGRGARLEAQRQQAIGRLGWGEREAEGANNREAQRTRKRQLTMAERQERHQQQMLELQRRQAAQPPIQVQTYRLPG